MIGLMLRVSMLAFISMEWFCPQVSKSNSGALKTMGIGSFLLSDVPTEIDDGDDHVLVRRPSVHA